MDQTSEDAISSDHMRAAFRSLAAGVVVVTCWIDGRPWGLTINSCCSISTSPSRLLISLQRRTRTCEAIAGAKTFGVNILAADQKQVAEIAASQGQPKFLDGFCDPRLDGRPPTVRSAIWRLECAVEQTFDVGDHVLVVGNVLRASNSHEHEGNVEPLLYFNRSYRLIGRQL